MVEQVTFQTLFQFLQTVGILVGIIYYLFIMRNSQRNQQMQLETRQLDLFMRWHQELTKPEVLRTLFQVGDLEWEDFDDFRRKYDHTINPEDSSKRLATWYFWDGIGYILSRGMIDADTVHDMLGAYALGHWIKFEPIIQEYRKQYDRHDLWKWLEYLMVEMKNVRERRGLTEYVLPDRPE